MIHKDYIMRMIQDIVATVRTLMHLPEKDKGGWLADLERAVGDAVNIEPDLFFSLEPESMVTMLDMGDVDDHLGPYIVRAIFLEANQLEAEEQLGIADLRRRQARAIAEYLKCTVPAEDTTNEALEAYFMVDPEERMKAEMPAAEWNVDPNEPVAPGMSGSYGLETLSEDDSARFKF